MPGTRPRLERIAAHCTDLGRAAQNVVAPKEKTGGCSFALIGRGCDRLSRAGPIGRGLYLMGARWHSTTGCNLIELMSGKIENSKNNTTGIDMIAISCLFERHAEAWVDHRFQPTHCMCFTHYERTKKNESHAL
jgi:hypothetical protein